MFKGSRRTRSLRWSAAGVVALAAGLAPAAGRAAPITYTDVARNPATGITFRRGPSATDASFDAIKLRPFLSLEEWNASPEKPRGAPGVAILDYDRDGDLDIYVPNGPGRANSLYQSRFKQTGQLQFVDVGSSAGVSATDQDSTGVCYGDIDNDGDEDLLVLGRMEASRLFRNEGNGTFTNITGSAGIGGGPRNHTSCSMGDINGDGLLDIFVVNTFDWARKDAINSNFFGFNQANELYVNQGGNQFADATASSGVTVLQNVPAGDATISWATALVDYDQDGDIDIMHADDQGALPTAGFAGIDRGLIQLFRNDGTGHFTNFTYAAQLFQPSGWMGFAFGDLNSDGHMDMFVPSVGDYMVQQIGIAVPPGLHTSRWFLGAPGGTFTNPGVGDLAVSPFGWGNGIADYDNDGDQDIIFYGSLDIVPFYTADNPGIVLANDGNAKLTWDQPATAAGADFVRRNNVNGVALGDLNEDGFVDIVWAAGGFVPEAVPLVPMTQKWGSVFDAAAFYLPTFMPIGPLEWEWSGVPAQDGFMGVKISSASTGNKSLRVSVKGTKGLTSAGKVNRDGIGAIVRSTPQNGKSVLSPVLGGSSYASQHSLIQSFGLGSRTRATIEVLWPGGVRNRLYDVRAGEHVTMPEVSCDFGKPGQSRRDFLRCVDAALGQLVSGGVITSSFRNRLRDSAERAHRDAH